MSESPAPARALVDEDGIRALIPHASAMCLLQAVLKWDDEAITCVSQTHRDPTNPLRRDGRLSALHAFEYGAQATAVHGGLRARAAGLAPPPGFLAGLRDARLHVAYLDDAADVLTIHAQRLFGDTGNAIYETRVVAEDVLLAQARITIVLRRGST
jgi:predicted hotdog family 3-hydroxylacyl-ACP dehydratase